MSEPVRGQDGRTGETGATGATGAAGARAKDAKYTQGQVLTIFAFVVACFLLLAVLSQSQARALRDNVRAQCESRLANVTRTNANWERLEMVERRADNLQPQELVQARIEVYAKARLVPPDCTGEGH